MLLTGDGPHHYAGGRGLNLGLRDATNLGWKLAAEIRAAPWRLWTASRRTVSRRLDVIDDSSRSAD